MRRLTIAAIAALAFGAEAQAQIVPETPPPSTAAPVPETAAEANARAVPRPPITRLEKSTTPGEPDTLWTIYPSNLEPPPAAALDRTYPPCSETVQDGCRNPGTGNDEPTEKPANETTASPRD